MQNCDKLLVAGSGMFGFEPTIVQSTSSSFLRVCVFLFGHRLLANPKHAFNIDRQISLNDLCVLNWL